MSSVKLEFDVQALTRAVHDFGEAVKDKATRPAAHQAALVFYDEMKRRVPVNTGTLRDSIYRWHDEKRSGNGVQTYLVGPNKVTAPHWHLVEYGYWQPFAVVRLPSGQFITAVRPEAVGMPKPSSRASAEVKAAYYVPRAGGAKWIAPRSYIRTTYDAKVKEALGVGQRRLGEAVQEILNGKR